jgi:hypothetical protein
MKAEDIIYATVLHIYCVDNLTGEQFVRPVLVVDFSSSLSVCPPVHSAND